MVVRLQIGARTSRELVIDRERTIAFMGENLRVYATPEIVWDAEMLCRDLLLEHLEPGHDSVGTRVEIDHLAAGLLGSRVRIEATVAEVAGRRVTFEFQVRDKVDLIATGRHERVAVALSSTRERLAVKHRKFHETSD